MKDKNAKTKDSEPCWLLALARRWEFWAAIAGLFLLLDFACYHIYGLSLVWGKCFLIDAGIKFDFRLREVAN